MGLGGRDAMGATRSAGPRREDPKSLFKRRRFELSNPGSDISGSRPLLRERLSPVRFS